MNRYLLDTNAALIALTEPDILPRNMLKAVLAARNVLSVVSYWEVVLKSMKGNLKLDNPGTWWRDALDQLSATPLLLRPEHIAELYNLPSIHKDPFDRVLIAQATAEGLEMLTTDTEIRRYASPRFRVLP